MRMAGERGWIPMSSSLLSRSHLAAHWRLVEAGAAGTGRQANRSQWRIARDVLVAPTSAMARERARAVLGRNYVQHQYPNRVGTAQMALTKLEPSMPDEAVTVDYLMENVWIVGDPAECVDKIQQLYDESGGFGALLSITTDSDDAGWDHESLRLLMDRVAPRVAHLADKRREAMTPTYRYDHMHLRSRDVQKTAQYYHQVFGAKILESIQSDGK